MVNCPLTYDPDVWVIVEVRGMAVPKTHHRVLAGWYGGYLGGDSWRMNSGITKIVEQNDYYEIHGDSGSVYNCRKNCEQLSRYTEDILNKYSKDNSDSVGIYLVKFDDIVNLYKEQ